MPIITKTFLNGLTKPAGRRQYIWDQQMPGFGIGRTLAQLGIPRATFHRWYDRFLSGGAEALDDCSPRPGRVWNRIPETVRELCAKFGDGQFGQAATWG